ncbi:SulP family inorganic anion transporter [Lewinella lacunae]|uniref:SulP family inorganic anion transporter n=1 Tax=Neolewinella lacunae TaxID=1517758 RepID=A0A923T911_9BACT|nr:SulP family inorganic anion transporter [Neolewinella lacunae]
MLGSWKNDLPASIVVFFVALPLCLGIALASGAPLFSGLIAGIIGGVVVGAISGSQLGVSGPAAGLAAIVLVAITNLGSYENFLLAVVIGGALQIVFGALKAGVIGYYFPSSVIKGMLTGIGIIIILKQIPHFFGWDKDPEGDFSFVQPDGQTTFSEIQLMLDNISPGATLIAFISLAILILWDQVLSKKGKIFTLIQGPLVAVVLGIIYFVVLRENEAWGISAEHLVTVPIPTDLASFLGQFSFPNFGAVTDVNVWVTGFTIALVASLETLLCVEATDKLDPEQRVTPTNRELFAQGTGNIFSGLIGGLPITQVIVRSSANIQSGGKTKVSAIVHGFLLLISVVTIPGLLNKIPLSVLAAILIVVGYKLAKPSTFISIYRTGWKQFVPFIVTVVGLIFTDLLIGICLGLLVGIFVILYKSYQNSHFLHIKEVGSDQVKTQMALAEEVTFLNKGAILRELDRLPRGSLLELDITKTKFVDYDVIEILENFITQAKERKIETHLVMADKTIENPESYMEIFDYPRAVPLH